MTAKLESDVVHLRVRDKGRWRGVTRGDRGHGLGLMRALMDSIEIDASDTGTVIRMRRSTGA